MNREEKERIGDLRRCARNISPTPKYAREDRLRPDRKSRFLGYLVGLGDLYWAPRALGYNEGIICRHGSSSHEYSEIPVPDSYRYDQKSYYTIYCQDHEWYATALSLAKKKGFYKGKF